MCFFHWFVFGWLLGCPGSCVSGGEVDGGGRCVGRREDGKGSFGYGLRVEGEGLTDWFI